MMVIEHAEWEALGVKLFGPDKAAWAFECPMCHNVASIELAKAKWPALRGRGWQPWAECIGRYIEAKEACDWAAYGLFRGPIQVIGVPSALEGETEGDGEAEPAHTWAFDFAHWAYAAAGLESMSGGRL